MNKIEKLLQELCPNGVQWKALGEVVEVKISPIKLKSKEYLEVGFIPIIDQGEKYIAGYCNSDVFLPKDNYVIFGDHSEHIKFIDFAFVQGADGLKILLSKSKINAKFLYYSFKTFYVKECSYKRHWTVAKQTNIPIPPLAVQEEIVKILDNFTELTAELTARKKQYTYYRDKLLNFDPQNSDKRDFTVEWKTLGEVGEVKRGKRVVKSQLATQGHFAVFQNSMTPLGYYNKSNVNANSTFIICGGAAGEIGYSCEKFWAADDVYFINAPSSLINKFIYYFLLSRQYQILKKVRRASIPRLSKSVIEKIQIPIPPLAEQEKIVSILDKFDTLVNSISEGLPKEIELRQKQYEYYREKLLSFKS